MERSESPVCSPKKLKLEQLKADYELFLQTFEKPTLIYRYLRVRQTLSPIFLHRTLLYLNGQKKRTPNSPRRRRRDIKCNEILETREKTVKESPKKTDNADDNEDSGENSHLNLHFSGFFHGPNLSEELAQSIDNKVRLHLFDEFVSVDVKLLKIFHKRRKDENMPMETIPLGSCKAPCNPRSELLNNGPTFTVNIPNHVFSETARSVKTFIVSIQLTLKVRKELVSQKGGNKGNGDVLFNLENNSKKDKPINGAVTSLVNGDDSEAVARLPKRQDKSETTSIPYSAEMIVFDKHKVPLLTNGDYELLLQRTDTDDMPEKENWEGEFSEQLGAFNLFTFGPTIKFHLEWSKHHLPKLQLPKVPSPRKGTEQILKSSDTPAIAEPPQQRIFYQFIYSNNTKQQTEARDDYYCPWCVVNCVRLYGLLKHLRLCHTRFSFIYTPINKGARIDVSLNENFDWNATRRLSLGSPQGAVLRGEGPLRLTSETQVLVSKAAPIEESLSEFLEPEHDSSEGSDRVGDRVYYHTNSCLPLLPQELEGDSEDKKAPAWIKEKTKFMIDEFTDVNPGEKELTKMWNIHVLSEGYIADFQMNSACQSFVAKYGQAIVNRRLKRNFLLHLCSLADFGLLPLVNVVPIIASLPAANHNEE